MEIWKQAFAATKAIRSTRLRANRRNGRTSSQRNVMKTDIW